MTKNTKVKVGMAVVHRNALSMIDGRPDERAMLGVVLSFGKKHSALFETTSTVAKVRWNSGSVQSLSTDALVAAVDVCQPGR